MKIIESRANPLFKQWLKEKNHAGRTGHSVWLEGPHLCQSWIESGKDVQWLVVDDSSSTQPEIEQIMDRVDPGCIVKLGKGLFGQISDVASHQGILVIAERPQHQLPDKLDQTAVVLDGVQDPGNVGTILRTCAAAGVTHVITTGQTAACWSQKVLRSAQGAHSGLVIVEDQDVAAWLTEYRRSQQRLPIIATSLHEASGLYQSQLPARAIWVFGNEGRGVSKELLALSDVNIRIDHDQRFVESLNVGVAAALCLFEQLRQHP